MLQVCVDNNIGARSHLETHSLSGEIFNERARETESMIIMIIMKEELFYPEFHARLGSSNRSSAKRMFASRKKKMICTGSLAYPRSLNRLGILFKIKEIIYDA